MWRVTPKKKNTAKLIRNISFDAGAIYEYSETSDTTSTDAIEDLVKSEASATTHFGFEFNKAGVVGMLKFVSATSNGDKSGNGSSNGIRTGYVLKDNDPADAFTVDVKKCNSKMEA